MTSPQSMRVKVEDLDELRRQVSSFFLIQELLEKLVGPQEGHRASALHSMRKRDYWFDILVYNVGTVARQFVYTANDVRPATKAELGRNITEIICAAFALAGEVGIDVAPHLMDTLEKYVEGEWKRK